MLTTIIPKVKQTGLATFAACIKPHIPSHILVSLITVPVYTDQFPLTSDFLFSSLSGIRIHYLCFFSSIHVLNSKNFYL